MANNFTLIVLNNLPAKVEDIRYAEKYATSGFRLETKRGISLIKRHCEV